MSAPITLVPRQRRFYTHRVNVYRKSRNASGDWTYDLEPVYEDLPCFVFFRPNVDTGQGGALLKQAMIFTYKVMHFPSGADIHAEDKVLFRTENHHFYNNWFSVEGEPDYHPNAGRRKANYGHCYLNVDVLPPGLEVPE